MNDLPVHCDECEQNLKWNSFSLYRTHLCVEHGYLLYDPNRDRVIDRNEVEEYGW